MNARTRKMGVWFLPALASLLSVTTPQTAQAYRNRYSDQPRERRLPGWKINTVKRIINLNELEPGGPGKDGIPAIDRPVFVSPRDATSWLRPVASLVISG